MTVLITGASSGIGLALTRHYQSLGKTVIACGRSETKLESLFAGNDNTQTLSFDVTNKQQVKDQTSQLAHIDTLILNAGDCEYFDSVMPFDSDKFERMIKVNVLSMGYCLEALLDKINPGGQLVIVSSSATLAPFSKAQGYGSAKAACSYLAKSLSVDLAEHNIAVTLVEPGFVKTPLTDKNTFAMPFLVSAEQAASIMVKAIARRKSLVRFPRSLMVMLHLLALLPINMLTKLVK